MTYRDELAEARRQGKTAHDAMEVWVSRPLEAPSVPGDVLEGHARQLRESRERIRQLLREQGTRDDIEEALAENEAYHRLLGLTVRDRPDSANEEDDPS